MPTCTFSFVDFVLLLAVSTPFSCSELWKSVENWQKYRISLVPVFWNTVYWYPIGTHQRPIQRYRGWPIRRTV